MPVKKKSAAPAAAEPKATKKARPAGTPKPKSAKPARKAKASPAERRPTHDEIADRAYALFRERGGNAFENWIEAERLVRAGK